MLRLWYWELVRADVIVPGYDINDGNFPYFTVTPHGLQMLTEDRIYTSKELLWNRQGREVPEQ